MLINRLVFGRSNFIFYRQTLPNTECSTNVTCTFPSQSLVIPEKFQHILRVLNTNIDGRRKIAFAITAIKVSQDTRF